MKQLEDLQRLKLEEDAERAHEIGVLQGHKKDLMYEIDELKTKFDVLQKKTEKDGGELAKEVQKLSLKIADLEKQLDDKNSQITSMKQSHSEEVSSINITISSLTESLELQQSECKLHLNEITNLKLKIDQITIQNTNLKNEKDLLTKTIKDLQTKYDDLLTKHNNIIKEMKQVEDKVCHRDDEIFKLKEQIEG
jgi:chromosome segregation ATPase